MNALQVPRNCDETKITKFFEPIKLPVEARPASSGKDIEESP